jgi:hypothetical protein
VECKSLLLQEKASFFTPQEKAGFFTPMDD